MRATLIIGGGPGGTGVLVHAAQIGGLDDWLDAGVALVDRSVALGGTLGRYIVNSDSLGGVYLECLDAPPARERFAPMRDEPVTREIAALRRGFPPLEMVDRYLRRLGMLIEDGLVHRPGCDFIARTRALAIHLRGEDRVQVRLAAADGSVYYEDARTAIVAVGGRQQIEQHLRAELLRGVRLDEFDPEKIMFSNDFLSAAGFECARNILARVERPRVVVLGGSHSAYSVAWALTQRMPGIAFADGDIQIVGRRDPRIFYEDLAAAAADGYPATEDDVCRRTGRVNRLAGLRGDGREMWRRIARKPGTEPDPRVEVRYLRTSHLTPAELRRLIGDATLVVPAFGYRSATLPVYDSHGRRLPLRADMGGNSVGADARLLLANGEALPNVFCIGLGTGFRPGGEMGGEPSFTGQANSLWLYQNHIGGVVYRGVSECLAASRRKGIRRIFNRSGHVVDRRANAGKMAADELKAPMTIPNLGRSVLDG